MHSFAKICETILLDILRVYHIWSEIAAYFKSALKVHEQNTMKIPVGFWVQVFENFLELGHVYTY